MTTSDDGPLPDGRAHPRNEPVSGSPGGVPAVDRLDELVPASDEVGNQVLADNARLVRWAAPVFLGCAAILLPWIVIAAVTLPSRQLSQNYDVRGPAMTWGCCWGWCGRRSARCAGPAG